MLGLYRAAMRVGRDHVASAVNTLVLAYAGAATAPQSPASTVIGAPTPKV